MAVVELKDVSRIYKTGEHEQKALDHVTQRRGKKHAAESAGRFGQPYGGNHCGGWKGHLHAVPQ